MDNQKDAEDALQFVGSYSSRCYISPTSVEGSQEGYLTQYWK